MAQSLVIPALVFLVMGLFTIGMVRNQRNPKAHKGLVWPVVVVTAIALSNVFITTVLPR
ncbi:MAG: hypothetical protein JWR80_5894 [Bradyrhizobium sp.]|nr:hypothetical protein [Bradyrhizobium sp.]